MKAVATIRPAVALLPLLFTLGVAAQERKLQRADLPAAVAATVDRETHGAAIKGYATEREHGREVYEAETILNGHTRDLQIDEDGRLAEIEEEVALSALPGKVRAGLEARAGGATITRVESLIKGGKLVAYEATTRKGTKKGEVQVDPNGGRLPHAE